MKSTSLSSLFREEAGLVCKDDGLGRILKRRRTMLSMTLRELAGEARMSPSHIGRIERGERFPSARILRQLADPLHFEQVELLALADYLPVDNGTQSAPARKIDPYVTMILSQEPLETHRLTLSILVLIKSLAKALNDNHGGVA